jgi:hypothetical protein
MSTHQKEAKLAEKIARFLNEALDSDYNAIATLTGMRIPCNKALADHPTIQVRAEKDGTFTLGLIGLLNGLIGADEQRLGYLAAAYAVSCPNGCNFAEHIRDKKTCPKCGANLIANQLKQFGTIEKD